MLQVLLKPRLQAMGTVFRTVLKAREMSQAERGMLLANGPWAQRGETAPT